MRLSFSIARMIGVVLVFSPTALGEGFFAPNTEAAERSALTAAVDSSADAAEPAQTVDGAQSASDAPTQPARSRTGEEASASPVTGFLYRTIEQNGERYAYCVYVPPDYSAERTWPVILALHGSGERGSDGLLQTEVGIGRAIRRNYKRVPAIVVMPQCRPDRWWTDEMLELALQCVQQTSRDYRLDPARIYLTGLSMGGAGSWSLASALPEQFAAVAPICGFYGQLQAPPDAATLTQLAKKLKDVPIWCFHGAADPAVPVAHSRAIVAALRAGGGDVQYTEYPDGQHNVWDRAYGDAAFWRWLFAQRREVSE